MEAKQMNSLRSYFKGDEMAANVWYNKYALRDSEGNVTEETPDDMHRRMAHYFAATESNYVSQEDNSKKHLLSKYGQIRKDLNEETIYKLFKDFKKVVPAGSVMSGLGNPSPVSLSNCWVIDGPHDSIDDIFRVCNEQSQLFKRRGGNGFDISKLRPNGAKVSNAAKYSTGAVSFMDLFSNVTNTIAQSGRRGALMISMHVEHPDAEEFIEKKQDLTKVTGANISIQLGDDFMQAVVNDTDYIQHWPIDREVVAPEDAEYNKLYETTTLDGKRAYYKKIRAKELWDKLIHCAWNTAEPGIIFKSRHYNYSPDGLYDEFRGSSTNPCLVGDTLIKTNDGDKTIKEIVEMVNNGENVEVYTYNEDTKEIELKNVEAGQLTKKNANIIEVECEDGSSIKLTPDHKVFTENRGWVEAANLNENDILINSKNSNNKIVSKNESENEDVYDLKVQDNHNFFANGILVHNCGEIFMHEDSCRLIHVNVSEFVVNPYTDKASINKSGLYEIFYETARLGDDLVDLECDAIEKILKKIEDDGDKGGNEYKLYARLLANTKRGRRCGIGFFGLADALAKLGHKFDSEEGLKDINEIMKWMFIGELDSEIDMAIMRGAFPNYSKEKELVGNDWYDMVKTEFQPLYDKMFKFGRRNVSFGTAAPTGSVAMLAHASSGIEPIFMPYYLRRVKCTNATDRVDYVDTDGEKFTEYITAHPTLKEWAENVYGESSDSWNGDKWNEVYQSSPWFGSTANDINWVKRVEIQGICQKYITHSISSTVNLPNDVSEEEVSRIYLAAWENGLKGITVYRDGCRGGVIVSTDKKKEEKPKEKICVEGGAKRRPKTLEAKIIRFNNKGDRWVGIVGMLDGKPYEMFTGMLEKLNIPSWVEEGIITKTYVTSEDGETKQSRYDLCYEDKNGEKFCVEGISRIFNPEFWNYGKLISGLLRHNMPISYIIKVISSLKLDDSSINTWKNGVVRALKKFESSVIVEGEKCPECGGRLVRDGGCIHCIDCGYSKCS